MQLRVANGWCTKGWCSDSGADGATDSALMEVVSGWFYALLNKFKIHGWKLPWSQVLTLDDAARAEEAEKLGFATLESLGDRMPRQTKSSPEYKVFGQLKILLRNAVDQILCSLFRSTRALVHA